MQEISSAAPDLDSLAISQYLGLSPYDELSGQERTYLSRLVRWGRGDNILRRIRDLENTLAPVPIGHTRLSYLANWALLDLQQQEIGQTKQIYERPHEPIEPPSETEQTSS